MRKLPKKRACRKSFKDVKANTYEPPLGSGGTGATKGGGCGAIVWNIAGAAKTLCFSFEGSLLPIMLNVRVFGIWGIWNSIPNCPGDVNISLVEGLGIGSSGTNL